MARFEDFNPRELRVISEALEWSQAEFFDPWHTREDRDTLQELIREAKQKPATAAVTWPMDDDDLPFTMEESAGADKTRPEWAKGIRTATADIEATEERKANVGAFDRGGHPIIRRPDGTTERMAAKTPTRPGASAESTQEPREYRGFLIIEYQECGDRHAFCAKMPMTRYRCAKCGTWTPLKNMSHLRVMCECGHRYSYNTNIVTDKVMDIDCLHCGAPVSVEWSERRKRYEPVDYSQRTRGPQTKGKKKGGKK